MKQHFIFNIILPFFILYSMEGNGQSYKSKKELINPNQLYSATKMPINNDLESKIRNKVIYVDNDGFTWYIIRQGIVKEYGTTRVVYPMIFKNKQNYHCYSIYKTKKDQLWVGTNKGAYLLNLKTEESSWIERLDKKKNEIIEFTSFLENNDGSIWIGTKTNQLLLYTKEQKIITYKIDESFYGENRAFNLTEIKEKLEDGSLLLLQGRRWFQFKDFKFKLLFDFNKYYSLYNGVNSVSFIPQKEQFKKSFSGSYIFSGRSYYFYYSKEINRLITSVPFYNAFSIYHNKNLLEGQFEVVASLENKVITSTIEIKAEKAIYKIINEININTEILYLKIDNDENILVQNSDGLFIIKKTESKFENFLDNKEEFDLKKAISCRSIIEQSDGTIIVMSVDNYFFKLTKNAKKFKKLHIGNKIPVNLYGGYRQNDSTLWTYGYTKGLYRVNLKKEKVTAFISQIPGPIEYRIYDVIQIKDKLIVGGSFGLEEFDLKTKKYRDISNIGNYNIRNKPVEKIYFDAQKSILWLGMRENNGLYKVDYLNNTSTHFSLENKNSYVVNNNVRYIYKSRENTIWIGTENGFQNIVYNTSSKQKKEIKITDENVTGVFEKENFVWYATYNGLKRLNKITGKIESFYKKDGLPDNEFNYKSTLEDSSGKLYFGGINGLTRVDTEKHFSNDKLKTLFLVKVTKFDEEINTNKDFTSNLNTVNRFNLPYKNNYLSLTFAINDLFNFKDNRYYYKIKEINKDWVLLGNNGVIQLNGINPGEYTLQVKGKTPNELETNTLVYKVYIEQIFYKTWWFIAIVIFLIVLSFSLISIYKIKQIRRQANQRLKLLNLEARALRSQMNSHFIFNILNSLQNLILENDEREVNRVFSEFSKLIRYTLNMSRIEFISFEEEIKYLETYSSMEKFRLNNKLDIKFNIDQNIESKYIKIPCMLFQPIIENAIIHGLKPKRNNRKLEISFSYSENFLIGTIKDNGIGREAANKNKEREHNSVGTHILKERLQILNYQKKNKILIEFIDLKEKNKGTGSVVKLSIPKTHF